MPKIRNVAPQIQADDTFIITTRDISGSGNSFVISGSAVTVTTNGYASASDVANLCRNLLGAEENFSTSSSPNLTAINNWLSSGCGIIETKLASDGWSVPVSNDTQLFTWLRDLNTLYAAARAEMSRINVTLAPGERTRGQVFEKLFWEQLSDICAMDLTTVGATHTTNNIRGMSLFVGGTSKSSKDSYNDNTDRVKPRFSKNMFSLPGIPERVDTDD